MAVAVAQRSYAEHAVVRLGRDLHPSEHVIHLEENDRILEDAKAKLAAVIEVEKRRAIRDYLNGRGPAALRLTDPMLRVLVELRDAGRAAARQEMRDLGVIERSFAMSLPAVIDTDPDLAELKARLSQHLYGMSRRVERESGAVGIDFGVLAAGAVFRHVERKVPGALNAAADLVSRGFGAGLGDVFTAAAGLFDGWLYSAIMDGGTCPVCRALDGTRYDTWDDIQQVLPDGGPNPSCHGRGRCRCRPVPIVDEDGGTPPAPTSGLPPDLTDAERIAVDRYVGLQQTEHGIDYDAVNGQLRGRWSIRGAPAKEIDEIVAGLDGAIAKAAPLDEPLTVFRGVNAQLDVRVGDVFEDAAFLSTSTEETFAATWSDVVGDLWEIQLPKGSKVLDLRGMRGRESEILLPRGSRLVIEGIEEIPSKYPGWMPPEANRLQWRIRARLLLEGEEAPVSWAGPEWAKGAVRDAMEKPVTTFSAAEKLAKREDGSLDPYYHDRNSVMGNVPSMVHREDEQRLLAAGADVEREVQRRIAALKPREYDDPRIEAQVAARRADLNSAVAAERETRGRAFEAWKPLEEQARRDVYVEQATAAGERVSPIKTASPFDPAVRAKRDAFYASIPELAEAERLAEVARQSLQRSERFIEKVRSLQTERYRRTLLEVLSEVREMGIRDDAKIAFQSAGRKGAAKQLIDEASAFYPSEWLRRMSSRGAVKVTYAAEGRGYFSSARATIKLSGWQRSKIPTDTPGLATAIHELGHFVEHAMPEVPTAEWSFFQRRTRPEGYGPQEREYRFPRGQGYGSTESYREDKFTDRYMGKTYGNTARSSYELISMGLESVWTGSHELDDEMRHFILGLLVGV